MSTKIHDLATQAGLGVSVAPQSVSANVTGDPVDLLGTDGNVFALLAAGPLNGDTSFAGSLQESSDLTTWAAIADVTLPTVAAENTAKAVTFPRTRRYVRALLTVSGAEPDGTACVVIGGQKKTV